MPVATNTPTIQTSVFVHPGAWSSAGELNFVKARIQVGSQPWTNQLNMIEGSSQGNQTTALFSGTSFNSCTVESQGQADSEAAYANALIWYLEPNSAKATTHANMAIAILNSWAKVQSIVATGGCYNEQNMLDAGWFGADFANAAEIMRSYPGLVSPGH